MAVNLLKENIQKLEIFVLALSNSIITRRGIMVTFSLDYMIRNYTMKNRCKSSNKIRVAKLWN
jgi:hypothetical protein